MRLPIGIALCCAAVSTALAAQGAIAANPAVPVAIRAARLVVGDGRVLDAPLVIVTGDRITSVAAGAQARV
nr:hypothetical protein [Gemmatimonadaceae bacterium]